MPDELLDRLRRFHNDAFPQYREQFQNLVDEGQHPTTLFIGCSDSRLVPYLLTGAGPGELFLVRNVGAFVPPYDGSHGHQGVGSRSRGDSGKDPVNGPSEKAPGHGADEEGGSEYPT